MAFLEISDLHVSVEDNEILKGLNLSIGLGEVHAIMGPNGSGKSTLAQVIAGHDAYEVTKGTIEFDGGDLFELSADERAREGIFLAFQYPVEIPGVPNTYFLREAYNAMRVHHGEKPLDPMAFIAYIKPHMERLDVDREMLKRSVNVGFSGGEKKRNEIFQMSVLQPRLAVLDETDSGLDIDALQKVAEGVNSLRSPDRSFIIVTHYQRLLNFIVPDFVHVIVDGRIVKSGGKELALELEDEGYASFESLASESNGTTAAIVSPASPASLASLASPASNGA